MKLSCGWRPSQTILSHCTRTSGKLLWTKPAAKPLKTGRLHVRNSISPWLKVHEEMLMKAAHRKETNYQTGKDLHMWRSQKASLFSAGTQIQLAETNCHIESLKSGDRVLVSASPRKDEAIQRAARVQKEASLVGFSKCRPPKRPQTDINQPY